MKAATLAVHDPGKLALRRGIRLAIGSPVLLGLLLWILEDPIGIPFGLFFLVSAVGTADFSGTPKVRLLACLISGAVCIPVIAIGMASTVNVVLLVLVTLVLGLGLFFLGVLRGLVAAGAPIVISQLAVAVTSTATLPQWPSILTGLTTGVVISALCLIFVLPTDRRRHVRDSIATALAAMTRVAALAWEDPLDHTAIKAAEEQVEDAVATVHRDFGGQPFRPAGVSRRDRALMQLVARMRVLRRTQFALVHQPRSIIPGTRALGINSGAAMQASALALRSATAPPPDLDGFPALLDEHFDSCAKWVSTQAGTGTSPEVIVTELQRAHATRVVATLTAQVAELAQQTRGEFAGSASEQVAEVRPWWRVLTINLNVHSPWLFSALRGGVAIALGAGVVHVFGLPYGLWVLLGVIAVLRVDALSTQRAAWQVVWGTALGAAVGTGIILLADVMHWPWLLWGLLPISALIVGWAPGAIGSVAVSQTAFSAMVLMAFAIIEWPTDLILGLTRLENMGLGALVAILCALLLWPRGVMGFLGQATSTAVRSCARVTSVAVSILTGDSTLEQVRQIESIARVDLSNSMEAIDLALVQRGTGSRLVPWMRVGDTSRALMAFGGLLTHIVQRGPEKLPTPLIDAVREAQHSSTVIWDFLAERCRTAQPLPLEPDLSRETETLTVDLTRVITAVNSIDLSLPANSRALCSSVWVIDWLALLDQLSQDATAALTGPQPAQVASA